MFLFEVFRKNSRWYLFAVYSAGGDGGGGSVHLRIIY